VGVLVPEEDLCLDVNDDGREEEGSDNEWDEEPVLVTDRLVEEVVEDEGMEEEFVRVICVEKEELLGLLVDVDE
jgi:hypothetical protein